LDTVVLLLLGAADELDAREDVDAAGQQHGEAADAHSAVVAGARGRAIPLVEVPTAACVVHVVEETMLRDEESITLERSNCADRERKRKIEKEFPRERGRKETFTRSFCHHHT